MEERNEILCSHLLALFQLADHFEETWKGSESVENGTELSTGGILNSLQKLLEPDHPLHRWNSLPECLRPLSFGLRTQILLLKPLAGDSLKVQDSDAAPRPDFHPAEMSERPWELALGQDIPSTHRLNFMLGACRGVLQGAENLKTACVFTLCLCLANGESFS